MMGSFQRERVIDCLNDCDPDELVDLLRISSWELMRAFPERVEAYLEREAHVEDDEEDDLY